MGNLNSCDEADRRNVKILLFVKNAEGMKGDQTRLALGLPIKLATQHSAYLSWHSASNTVDLCSSETVKISSRLSVNCLLPDQ